MKKNLLIALCLVACLLVLTACGSKAPTTAPDSAVSEPTRGTTDFSTFTAEDFDGNIQSGTVFSGHKLTMINIWGTFCGPCINEMPGLQLLSEAYGNEFQIIGIPIDIVDMNGNVLTDVRADADAILELTGVTYLQLLPSRSLNELYLSDVQVFPTTLFVDENGVIIDEAYIGSRSYDDWKQIVDAYLEAL